MSVQATTQGKFVKYWEHETPEVIRTEKNELRIYAQHGKIQVYPIIEGTALGIGKGATINVDSFTADELQEFKNKFIELINRSETGYLSEKKYWEHEQPYVISSEKNEIRFYFDHGKLQVFPKINVGRGIGRGATLNLEGISQEQIDNIFKSFSKVIDNFAQLPDFNEPTLPEDPKQKSKTELLQELLSKLDDSKLEKLMALLNEEQEEQKETTTQKEKMSDDDLIKLGVEMYLKARSQKLVELYTEKGYDDVIKYLKDTIGKTYHGWMRESIQGQANTKGITISSDDGRKFKLSWKELFDKFMELHPELFVQEELTEDEKYIYENADLPDDDTSEEDEELPSDESNEVVEKQSEYEYVRSYDDKKLLKEFEKNSNIESSKFNPELTAALYEEIKNRVKLGKLSL